MVLPLDWNEAAVEQLDWHWRVHLRPRLAGLTDDEYFWEPAQPCWSLRRREEATSSHAAGKGPLVLDFARPEPVPVPVTTIAWRLCHIGFGVFGERAANHFGPGAVGFDEFEWPATAAEALAWVDREYAAWTDGVRSLDDAGMRAAVGPAEGPFEDHPMGTLVLHINREAIHHGAEVLLLRDLYRSRA
jgi:hypothetical protein